MLDILRLTVRNAGGSGWEYALKEALRQVEGVVGVTASYKASLIGITFDASKISSGALRARVEALGYDVTLCG
jgi:copper chaperone CopZ